MNILPKKRWHVRTKDNIAKVRKDEAEAAEEKKKKELRIQIAEREARTEALRKKARQQYGTHHILNSEEKSEQSNSSISKHINLFFELETNNVVSNKKNEEHQKEKKMEKEKYEKQIGYLTYLGQDTNELTGNVSWYNKSREEIYDSKDNEVSKKQKIFEDPLVGIRKYLQCDGIKKVTTSVKVDKEGDMNVKHIKKKEKSDKYHKKKKQKKSKKKSRKKYTKKYSSDSEEEKVCKKNVTVNVSHLRAERLRREAEEKKKAEEFFARLSGIAPKKEEPPQNEHIQKYNSQFNPHLAKQNYLK